MAIYIVSRSKPIGLKSRLDILTNIDKWKNIGAYSELLTLQLVPKQTQKDRSKGLSEWIIGTSVITTSMKEKSKIVCVANDGAEVMTWILK